eukprot:TRINITY_DN62896_c0_g1_i1.p1 TRINITY_DN62896_c0_g1~~TRINITY_DN62896_c0_g1_i1.p1  ORF type:complete len:302 (-),score=27.61 TRINITY_DN62896_c0_g1_i1:345-1205(-)
MESARGETLVELSPGCLVRILGLVNRPELNGCEGRVMKWVQDRGRWQVQVCGAESPQLFRAECLEAIGSVEVNTDCSMTPTVRLANANDAQNSSLVANIVEIVNDAYRAAVSELVHDPSSFVRTDEEDITERLEGINYGAMRRYMVLGFMGAEVVGCSSVTTGWRHPQRGQFGMLAVARSWQRRGIALQLIDFAEKHCIDAGMVEMQCEEMTCKDGSHETSNWMMAFYQKKLGYSIVDEYFCPAGHRTRGARTNRDLQFLIYRKRLSPAGNEPTQQKRPSWFNGQR